MAKLKIKNSVTAGSAPSGLSFGEMAVNITDRKIFIGNAVEGVVTLHDQNNIVTSVNGATGAVQGVSAASAGTGISVSGATGAVTITNTGVISFNGSTGAVVGVSSVNGFTGAVTNLNASTVTTTSSNVNATRYLTFVGGTGNTGIFIDDVTTPLTYTPAGGAIGAKKITLTTSANVITVDSATPNFTITDGIDIVDYGIVALAANNATPFEISNPTGLTLNATNSSIQFLTGTGSYVFPNTNGSNGQVLTTNGSGTLTWQTPSSGLSWTAVTSDQTMAVDTGYLANKSSGTLTLTLPTTSAVGKTLRVSGMQNTWRIAQNASQKIHFGKTTTTTGVGGYLENTNAKDSVELVCAVANLEWNVISSIGNITIV